ncbi:MAG: polysaccharide biosynthesis C-terminal domain-containing protein [Dehalococcoidia bacterium]
MGIASGSLVSLIFRVGEMFMWGFIGVLTARMLSVEERGVYATAIVLTSAVGGISSFSAATGYFVSNQKRDAAEVASNALFMAIPLALLILCVGIAASFFVDGEDGRVVVLATLCTAPALLRNTSLGVILGQNSVVKYNFGGDVAVILGLVFISVWVGVLDHRTAEGALQAWCAGQYLSLIPVSYWGRTWLAWALSHRPDFHLMRRMVRFSAVTGVGSIVGILNYRVDQLLVIRLDGKEGAGIYSSAIAVAEGLWLFSSAITLASFARVGRGESSEAARLTATGIRHTFLVVVCGGLSAAILGPILIQVLFGHAYASASGPVRILSLGTALFAPQGLINLYYVNQRGRPAFPLFIGVLSITISVTVGLILIPIYGTNGAAWATTISYGTASTISVSLFLRQTHLPFSELWRVRRSDIAAYFRLMREVIDRLGGRPIRAARVPETPEL